MSKLKDLLDRRAELDREIEETRRSAKSDAIAKVRALMSENDLSLADISARSPTPRGSGQAKTTGTKVAAKYRNEATGDSWSGRGLQPKWLKAALAAGRKIEDFAL